MRNILAKLVVPVALAAAACSQGPSRSAGMPDDLQKDLELASASAPVLATPAGDYQPMRFVSEVEQARVAAPVERTRAPRRVAARAAALDQAETSTPAPEPEQEIQVAQAPAMAPETPAPASDVPSVPTVAPRPAPMPVDVPAMEGEGRGGVQPGPGPGRGGIGIGDVIGVVIRGGGVGPDHCPPRRRGRGGIMGGMGGGMGGLPRY